MGWGWGSWEPEGWRRPRGESEDARPSPVADNCASTGFKITCLAELFFL